MPCLMSDTGQPAKLLAAMFESVLTKGGHELYQLKADALANPARRRVVGQQFLWFA